MRRDACSSCGGTQLHTFLDLGTSPIADAYTETPDEVQPTYPLELVVCRDCWLVQLLEVVPDLFGTGYSFYSSASAPLSRYHQDYAHLVITREQELIGSRKPFLVEIGCNDGDFLRHFKTAGWKTLGVDPATGPAQVAAERGLDVITQPFGKLLGAEIAQEHDRRADVVVANHVLAHVEDVDDVMAGIAWLLDPNGTAYVEVQYLPDMLVNNAFDLVYHEHRNFFSFISLLSAASRWMLRVRNVWLTERQGGSLRVELTNQVTDRSRVSDIIELMHSERWLRKLGAYDGMQGRAERIADRLRRLIHAERSRGRSVAGYGAPAKATTLLNFAGIDASMLEFTTDTTAAKQGRYVPGTGIRIREPILDLRAHPDTYVLLAWNYLSSIVRRYPGQRWIVPIPSPTLL